MRNLESNLWNEVRIAELVLTKLLDLGKSYQPHCLLAEKSISAWPKQSSSGELSSEENFLSENWGPYHNNPFHISCSIFEVKIFSLFKPTF